MGSGIDPEAGEPSSTQAFEQSDRNPAVTNWNGTDSEGGQLATPASSESRVTQPGQSLRRTLGWWITTISTAQTACRTKLNERGNTQRW